LSVIVVEGPSCDTGEAAFADGVAAPLGVEHDQQNVRSGRFSLPQLAHRHMSDSSDDVGTAGDFRSALMLEGNSFEQW